METQIAKFTVRIVSVDNGSWQGEILSDDKSFWFQSELQLLRWVHANYPELFPQTSWNPVDNQPL